MTTYLAYACWVAFGLFVAYLLWLGPPRRPLRGPERRYRVTWTAELDASSPEEAAHLASEVLDQPGHTATRFAVEDVGNGAVVQVETAPDDGPPGENPVYASGRRLEGRTW